MTNARLITLAVLSIAVSLSLGLIDYETTSFWSLFSLQNIPALIIYAALAFTLLLVLSLLASSGKRAVVSIFSGEK